MDQDVQTEAHPVEEYHEKNYTSNLWEWKKRACQWVCHEIVFVSPVLSTYILILRISNTAIRSQTRQSLYCGN